jgi:hypothetical protein
VRPAGALLERRVRRPASGIDPTGGDATGSYNRLSDSGRGTRLEPGPKGTHRFIANDTEKWAKVVTFFGARAN